MWLLWLLLREGVRPVVLVFAADAHPALDFARIALVILLGQGLVERVSRGSVSVLSVEVCRCERMKEEREKMGESNRTFKTGGETSDEAAEDLVSEVEIDQVTHHKRPAPAPNTRHTHKGSKSTRCISTLLHGNGGLLPGSLSLWLSAYVCFFLVD